MQISFTGLKNMGFEKRISREIYDDNEIRYLDPLDQDIDKDDYDADITELHLNVQLTDDFNGKDLSEYKNALKRSGYAANPHPNDKSFLNIQIVREDITDDYTKPVVSIYLNTNEEEIEINDKNLPILSFIGQLMRKIANKPNREFIVNKDFMENEASTALVLDCDLKENYGDNYEQLIDYAYSPKSVKYGSKEILKELTDIMLDYFA